MSGPDHLESLVGEWSTEVVAPWAPEGDLRGRVTFEWMAGERFLIQRWEVPVPEAPDGLAIIGRHDGGDALLQHYFDSRGVARVYEMSLDEREWRLWRTSEDFSPLAFHQRFTGRFEDGGRTIAGAWEISGDGSAWEHDFELIHRRSG